MTTMKSRFIAIAGLCAAAAGAIFIGVQIGHPPSDAAHIATTNVMIRETAKILMSVLAIVGFTGMFLVNRSRFGRLGRIGYALLTAGYAAMFVAEMIIGYYIPTLVHSNPTYVQHVINAAISHGPSGGIGWIKALLLVMGVGYPIGGLLFGIALFRARVLSRWAALLLAYASISVLALPFLPFSFSRPFAVPDGIALIGLGVSLYRKQRSQPNTLDASAANLVAQPVTL